MSSPVAGPWALDPWGSPVPPLAEEPAAGDDPETAAELAADWADWQASRDAEDRQFRTAEVERMNRADRLAMRRLGLDWAGDER